MINLFSRLSQRRGKSLLSTLMLLMLGTSILSPSAEARLIFTTEDDGAEADTYTLDVDGTVTAGQNIDLSLVFGANLGEELKYNDSLGYFILTDGLNLQGDTLSEFKIGSNAGAPVVCNAGNVGYTYYNTTTTEVEICNEDSPASGTYSFNSVEDITAGSITTTEILNGTIATVDIADNAVTAAKIGTAGVGDANKLLGTDASGNPQWEDKSDYVSSTLTSGQMLVGNGSNIATGVTISGDATIDNAGALSLAANSVDSAEIAAGAVDTAELLDGAVTSAKILDGTIATGDIAAGAITGGLAGVIADGTITADDLGADSVGSSEIAADAVDSAEIAADAVGASEIAVDAVGASELADNAVDTNAIANSAVTAAKIADGAVSGGLAGIITDGSITADDLGVGSVDSSEIATDAVGAAEIAANAVGASELDLTTVTLADFTNDLALTDTQVFVGNGSNVATGVALSGDATISNTGVLSLAADSVDSAEIVTDAVGAAEIAAGAVGTSEIAADAVTTTEIGTAGVGDANKVLTTDVAGDPQWEDKSNFGTSTLTSANIFVGNVSNVATGVALSGDATIDNAGALSLATDTVSDNEIDYTTVTLADFTNDPGYLTTVDISADTNLVGGTGATLVGDTLNVDLGTTIETGEITDGTILAGDFAAGAVSGGLAGVITDGSITADDLGVNSVSDSEIDYTAVTLADFTNDSGYLTTVDISADTNLVGGTGITLTGDTLSADLGTTIETGEITDGTVATIDIADNAIDGAKLGIGTTAGDTLYFDGTDWLSLGIGTAGQVLKTNAGATAPEWAASASGSFSGLSDTTIAAAADGNILVYDNATSKWVNKAMSGDATIDELGALALAANSVDSAEIATDAVGSAEIAADAVGASEIVTGGVATAEILNGTILAEDLANGSINGGLAGVITDGSITADDLGVDSVGASEIAADAVGASEIATGAVGTDEISNGSVVAVDLNLADITLADFTNDLALTDTQVFVGNGSNVATGVALSGDATISNTGVLSLATDTVSDNEIDYTTVTLADFTNDPGYLTTVDISANTNLVGGTGATLVGDTLNVDLGTTIETGEITDGTILAGDFAAGAVSGGLAGVITDGSITADDLGVNSVSDSEIDYTAVTLADFTNDSGYLTTVDISADTNLVGGTGITLTGDTLSADLGTTIETGEITDGTVATIDIADNAIDGAKLGIGTTAGDTLYFNGTDWLRLGIGTAGQVLQTNVGATAPEWAAAAAGNFAGLSDTTIAAAANGNILVYDNLTSKWVNKAMSGDATIDELGALALAADSVAAAEIATDAVGSAEIVASAVGDSEIDYTAVTLADFTNDAGLLDNTLTDTNILVGNGSNVATGVALSGDATISNTGVLSLAADSVAAAEIATDAVGAAEIVASAVGDSEVDYTAVTLADFTNDAGYLTTVDISADTNLVGGTGATLVGDTLNVDLGTTIETGEITDGTILAGDFAAGAVSGGLAGVITDGSITADDLGVDSVDSSEIAANAVGASELDLTTVTLADFTNDLALTDTQVFVGNGSNVATGVALSGDATISNTGVLSLAANSVDSAEIVTDAVTASEIATGAVTTDEILDGTITRTDMAEIETFYTMAPEFSNFTLRADGSNNKGTMLSDHDTTTDRNYYAWSTRKTGALNDYDLVLQWMIPENFTGFSATNPEIEIDYKTDLTTIADNRLDIVSLLDTAGSTVTLTGGTSLASTVADTWVNDAAVTFAGGTFTPGEYITMTFRFASKATTRVDKNPVYLGPVKFNIKVK